MAERPLSAGRSSAPLASVRSDGVPAGLPERSPRLVDVPMPATRWIGAGRAFARTALRRRFDVRVEGGEHVPPSGPVILASNHMGYLDGPLVFGFAPRPVHSLVKHTMYVGRIGRALRQTGQIPVNRRQVDPRAVKTCLRVLAAGGVVAIYPEGVRGVGDVSYTKPGAAYLALVTGAPVVPVACLGTRSDGAPTESMPARGTRVDVVFGTAVQFEAVRWPRTRAAVADVQEFLQASVADHVRSACAATGQTLPAMPAEVGST